MVLKLLLVILALLVLDTSAQYLNRIPLDGMDLYRFGFAKDHNRRQKKVDEEIYTNTITRGTTAAPSDNFRKTSVNTDDKPAKGTTLRSSKREDIKSAIRSFEEKMEFLNLLRSLPREEMSDPVIFVPEEFDYKTEK